MDRVTWITRLSIKNPSPALTLSLLTAVATLVGTVTFLFFKIESVRDECEVAALAVSAERKKELSDAAAKYEACLLENKTLNSSIIVRVDRDSERRSEEYQKRIDRLERAETQRTRADRERGTLIIDNNRKLENLKSNENP